MKQKQIIICFRKVVCYIKIIHRKYNLRLLTSGPPCKELRCCYSIITTRKKLEKKKLNISTTLLRSTAVARTEETDK